MLKISNGLAPTESGERSVLMKCLRRRVGGGTGRDLKLGRGTDKELCRLLLVRVINLPNFIFFSSP